MTLVVKRGIPKGASERKAGLNVIPTERGSSDIYCLKPHRSRDANNWRSRCGGHQPKSCTTVRQIGPAYASMKHNRELALSWGRQQDCPPEDPSTGHLYQTHFRNFAGKVDFELLQSLF